MHRLFPDEGWGETADRIGDYLATSRDEVEDHWPPVPDHWTAYGLAETVAFPERDPARPLTDAELEQRRAGRPALFGSQVRWVSQQAGPWGAAVRGTFTPRGGGYGVVGEALTGLWLVAEADGRLAGDRSSRSPSGPACIAALAMDAQARRRRGGCRPAARTVWTARGSSATSRGWTTSSTPSPRCCAPSPSSRRTRSSVRTTHRPDWLWLLALVADAEPVATSPSACRAPGARP